nr:FRG domain-containing protein [uncultured Psychroserpens sp.]
MKSEIIENWTDLVELEQKLSCSGLEWVFRGQSSTKLPLRTTLERALDDFNVDNNHRTRIEQRIFNDFKRTFHLHSNKYNLDFNDSLSWLAVMRHYGTPNRLLDFTYSLFVASFFALEFSTENSLVWAVNKSWLADNTLNTLLSKQSKFDESEKLPTLKLSDKNYKESWWKREGWVFDELFFKNDDNINIVAPVNPLFTNDRLLVQQALFLCSSDIDKTFQESLFELENSDKNIVKIEINKSAKDDILLRMNRAGTNRATLFPGLEGYASSLRTKILQFKTIEELQDSGGRPEKPENGV